MKTSERGDSLIEVIVAVAIAGIALAALLGGTLTAAHRFGPDAVDEALTRTVRNETRIAQDLAKYQGVTFVPAVVATTIPLAGSLPIPAHVSLGVSSQAGTTHITLTAQSDADASKTASLETTLDQPQPLPSSTVLSGTLAPAPLGAH